MVQYIFSMKILQYLIVALNQRFSDQTFEIRINLNLNLNQSQLLLIQNRKDLYITAQNMSTQQNRKNLNTLNDTLRTDNMSMKRRQSQMISHIQTLIRRQKQLSQLKQQLLEEQQKAKQTLIRQRLTKQNKCARLQIQIENSNQQLVEIDLTLANLQEQYRLCLKDYDKVLAQIASILQTNKVFELQLAQQKQKRTTIQTMIFDYQRLERVLQDEKKYFRELSSNEQKSHAQRIREFESMRLKLIKDQKQSYQRKFTDRFRIGFLKLNGIFKSKVRQYGQLFLRGYYKFQKLTDLGIGKFKNCLRIGTSRYNKQVKRVFTSWHHNVFPRNVINNIVQNSLKLNIQSKIKIKTLNRIVQKLNTDNLNLLHLYQRTKIVCLTANSIKQKQVHLTFCRWRQRSSYLTRVKYFLEKIQGTAALIIKRNAFDYLKGNAHFLRRFEVASHLLNQYQNSKDLSWALRKWRLQVYNREIQVIQRYIQNIKKYNLIQQRIKYEKRKVKALTNLQLCMSKIQMRNYFSRYYQNVKCEKLKQIQDSTGIVRQQCIEARKQNKLTRQFLKQKHREIGLTNIFNMMRKQIINEPFLTLKRQYQVQKARKQALMLVILKKQGKNKFYIMNQLRKNVQFYQKKQMHQQLTDLNNKMQEINEKSTGFRQALKITIQDLGSQSSKKINQVFQYTLNCQKKVFYDFYSRKSIQKKFKHYLIARSLQIFTHYCEKNVLNTLQNYCKDQKKQKMLLQLLNKFQKQKSVKTVKKTFSAILHQLKLHKNVFAKFIHVQNVMYFYRLQCGLISIMKKAHQQTIKIQNRNVQDLSRLLGNKRQNLTTLMSNKNNLQQKLKSIFSRFISFQQISQRNKQNSFLQNQKRKYFQIYRNNVRKKQFVNQALTTFVRLLEYKNYFIFWKSLITTNYESKQVVLRDELGKINKKIKNFDQKTSKTILDIERKNSQEQKYHQTKQNQAKYYTKMYTGILAYYDKNHQNLQKQRYLRSIFYVWKRQFLGAKRFGSAIYKILRRTKLVNPYKILFEQFRNYDSQHRSQLICASLLQKKYKKSLNDGFNLWRYNMRHGYASQLKYKVVHIDDHHEQIRNGIFSRGQSYADQVIRNKKYNAKSLIFMAFKNNWASAKQSNRKISSLLDKVQNRRIFQAIRNWKWLAFYKKTKRAYLDYKKESFKRDLKKDVFLSLKIHRQQIYNITNLTDNFVRNIQFQFKRFAMSKIINTASFQKNQLVHQRKKALHTLLMNKVTRQKTIKRTVMWKWQSELIPRKHYLCNVIKSIEQRILKSGFANINQKKYWNQFYIKDIAEKVTTEGYSDVTSITNILIREGLDPDQIKDYLRVKNQKDNKMISQAIGHMRAWPAKQKMIQAFHSWKEYLQVRKSIKRSLSKVFNFSTGLGRYFDKWKKKDPAFNQILQKQSRANMLDRYKELNRLMKQYRRDIKDSLQNCQQLRQINDDHAKNTKITVQMALSNLSDSVHKGMKQGLHIWRIKAKQDRVQQTNQRYDELADGISMLDEQKRRARQKIKVLQNENMQLKQKCKWGQQCGQFLRELMSQKDGLTIDLAEKQHNLKILLEDNLRLKQKIKIAKDSAMKLILKVKAQQSMHSAINE